MRLPDLTSGPVAADLRSVLLVLDDDRRAWLAGALDRVHPDHPWREHLGPPV